MSTKKYLEIFDQENDIKELDGRFLDDDELNFLHENNEIDLDIYDMQMIGNNFKNLKQKYDKYLIEKISTDNRQTKLDSNFPGMVEVLEYEKGKKNSKNVDAKIELTKRWFRIMKFCIDLIYTCTTFVNHKK